MCTYVRTVFTMIFYTCFTESLFIPIEGWLSLLMTCHWRVSFPSPSTLLLWKVSCVLCIIIAEFFHDGSMSHKHFNMFPTHVVVSSPEELAVVGESHSFPLWFHFPLQYATQRSLTGMLCIPLIPCFNILSVGGDTRIRISYQEEELELKLPFGSHSRLFLSEVNRAWSGRSKNTANF